MNDFPKPAMGPNGVSTSREMRQRDQRLRARARDSVARQAWQESYELLSEIDGRSSLSREELVFLASAAYLSGHPDTSLEAWEPAHEQALQEDDRGDAAAAAAVAIQRALLEHRLKQGFAPSVRIGLHVAEATKERSDWSGVGIHAASRIGALAEAEEILVSIATAEAAGAANRYSEPRVVSLKGLSEPFEVVAVEWR